MWQRRKAETSQLASKTVHCLYSYTLLSPSHSAHMMLCTAQARWHRSLLDSVLSSPAWYRLASRSRVAGTWRNLVSKPDISTNFLYQRSWCCENFSYFIYLFFLMLSALSWFNKHPTEHCKTNLNPSPIHKAACLGARCHAKSPSSPPQAHFHYDKTHPVACSWMDANSPTVGGKKAVGTGIRTLPMKTVPMQTCQLGEKSLFLSLPQGQPPP